MQIIYLYHEILYLFILNHFLNNYQVKFLYLNYHLSINILMYFLMIIIYFLSIYLKLNI